MAHLPRTNAVEKIVCQACAFSPRCNSSHHQRISLLLPRGGGSAVVSYEVTVDTATMTSAVRSRIATYEAQNQQTRRAASSSPSRITTNSKGNRSGTVTEPGSPKENGAGWNRSSSNNDNDLASQRQPNQAPGSAGNAAASTALASQNRISRIRQQQQVREVGPNRPSNLIEKRKQIKERRFNQQKRAEAAAAASALQGAESLSLDSNENGTRNGAKHRSSAPSNSIDLTRRTEYRSRSNSPATSSQPVQTNRLNNYPGSGSRRSVPTADNGVPTEHPERDNKHRHTKMQSNSPGTSSHNRMSKMQRMQRMKGYDHVKRGQSSRHSAPVSESTAAETPAQSSANAASASLGGRSTGAERGRLGYGEKKTASASSSARKRRQASPPVSPRNDTSQIRPNGLTLSPRGNDNTFSHLHESSPQSGTDVFSDSNYTQGHPMDTSVDLVTDDEATLTSVRRIMSRNNQDSPSSQSHQYHELKSQSRRRLDGSAKQRGGKDLYDGSHSEDPSHGYASGMSWTDGRETKDSSPQMADKYHRQPPDESNSRRLYRKGRQGRHEDDWLDEEKSEKEAAMGGVFRSTSSSDYDTDGDVSKTSRHSHHLEGPVQSKESDANDFFVRSRYTQGGGNHRKMDDDDRTFDYGDRDDDSNGSASYAARRRREAERRTREANALSENRDPTPALASGGAEGESPLINKDDVAHYTKSLDTPAVRIGAGVFGAATVVCVVLGPVGLLVGAAAVGIGVGVMQIPEEERNNLQAKAQKKFHELQDKAVDASESISSSCAATYKDSGVADHLPQCLSGSETVINDHDSTRSVRTGPNDGGSATKGTLKPSIPPGPQQEAASPIAPVQNEERLRNKRVACLRHARIIPVGQIHGLDPAAQPRAWLDVVASANTTDAEKNEAMEEILILAKDKRRARIFLEEGILDSIIWTLSRYFEKKNAHAEVINWANPDISPKEKQAVKLAAMCCVTLGKAHCAAIHTEGDLLLMSLYERGTVPEERQVAQMLHEVPHHVRVTKTPDPTIVTSKEIFAMRQLTLPQAEELSKMIKSVADGQL